MLKRIRIGGGRCFPPTTPELLLLLLPLLLFRPLLPLLQRKPAQSEALSDVVLGHGVTLFDFAFFFVLRSSYSRKARGSARTSRVSSKAAAGVTGWRMKPSQQQQLAAFWLLDPVVAFINRWVLVSRKQHGSNSNTEFRPQRVAFRGFPVRTQMALRAARAVGGALPL